jgi:hypothetical protein
LQICPAVGPAASVNAIDNAIARNMLNSPLRSAKRWPIPIQDNPLRKPRFLVRPPGGGLVDFARIQHSCRKVRISPAIDMGDQFAATALRTDVRL